MATDPAFDGAGQAPGIQIWRVENFEVVKQPVTSHGTFYENDAYIVLRTDSKRGFSSLSWDIHFWLGSGSAQDERGVAAYKTVELDDFLGGSPVQHREVQEHESKKFLSYFKKGIEYLKGGVASGFNHVEDEVIEPRLLQVKGKRNVRVRQVDLSLDSLNKGDVFVLDEGSSIWVWNGPDSNKMERMKGIQFAKHVRDDMRSGRAIINIIDQVDWSTNAEFFGVLGASPTTNIAEAHEGGEDVNHEKQVQKDIVLYRVSESTGSVKLTEVGHRPLVKDFLETQDCFILDGGESGVFVWVGAACTKAEREAGMRHAEEFVQSQGYPDWTPVTRVVEHGEPPVFKTYFASWPEAAGSDGQLNGVPASHTLAVQEDIEAFDVMTMHSKPGRKSHEILVDDGSGEIQVFRIEDFAMIPLEPVKYGIFYGGDSYVITYTYQKYNGQDGYIVYFWQGLSSSQDEIAASAILATKVDEEMFNGQATQVRVIQSKEPDHFMRMFHGKMIVFLGGKASGFKNISDEDENESEVRMFHIRANDEFNQRAIEVIPKAASLNSNDVFVVELPSYTFTWRGKGANKHEKLLATNVVKLVTSPDHGNSIVVDEGEEPDEFWEALGGKTEYASGNAILTPDIPPRLFHCSTASGSFAVEEIDEFDQEDLSEDDVMILDTYDEVFVWIGDGARAEEKKEALHTAIDYIKSDPSERNETNTVIVQVKQGFEPPSFTGHFLGWNPEKWSEGMTYEEMVTSIGEENAGVSCVFQEIEKYSRMYSFEELLETPEGVDPTQKERHLKEEEFQDVFGLSKDSFYQLPIWKQQKLKKEVDLF